MEYKGDSLTRKVGPDWKEQLREIKRINLGQLMICMIWCYKPL